MKKLTYAWLAALVLAVLAAASCVETSMEGSLPLSVSPAAASATKAPVAGTAFPADSAITLSAHYDDPAGTYSGDYFRSLRFARSGAAWVPATPKYWPHTGTLDFMGMMEVSNPGTLSYPGSVVSAAMRFAMADNSSCQSDLMFAYAKGRSRVDGPVAMTFLHAEAQVAFSVKAAAGDAAAYSSGTNTGVTVTRIVLDEAFHSGTVTAAAGAADGAVSFTWTDLASAARMAAPNAAPRHLAAASHAFGNGIVLPPQDAVGFTVEYVLHNGRKADGLTANDNALTYSWAPAAGTVWEAGHRYVYEIEFSLDEITVSPTVQDWNAAGTASVAVPPAP